MANRQIRCYFICTRAKVKRGLLEAQISRVGAMLAELSSRNQIIKTLRLAVVIILTALCWSTFGFVLFLDGYYYRTRPREPDPKEARIYPQDVKTIHHVARVYLTRTEKMPYEYFWLFCAAFAVTAYLLNERWKCLPPFRK